MGCLCHFIHSYYSLQSRQNILLNNGLYNFKLTPIRNAFNQLDLQDSNLQRQITSNHDTQEFEI